MIGGKPVSSATQFSGATISAGVENGTDADGYLAISTTNAASTSVEHMRIDSSGIVKLITANDTAGTFKRLTFGTNSFNRADIIFPTAATYDV